MLWGLFKACCVASTAFCAFRPASSRVLFLMIGLCELLRMCLRVAAAVCVNGFGVFEVRQWTEEPECLRDPELGVHATATLKGSTKVHYVSAGSQDSPLVILLHGFPDCWYSWHKQIPELKRNFWVVAPDMRGYGLSSKPSRVEEYQVSYIIEDLVGLVRLLGRDKLSIVGHDWGAIVAWCFSNKYPHMVNKLVTINGGHPHTMRRLLDSSISQMIKSGYMVAYQCPYVPEVALSMGDFAELKKLCSGFDPQETSVLQYFFSQPGALTAAINYYRAAYCKERQLSNTHFNRLDVPTLVIWGSKDPYLTVDVADLSRRQSRRGFVRYLQSAGHWPHLEEPAFVNAALSAFLLCQDESARPRKALLRRCKSSL
ncbi:AB hydrolase superfamily protein YfhM-like [Haemaphysalis longicornis]